MVSKDANKKHRAAEPCAFAFFPQLFRNSSAAKTPMAQALFPTFSNFFRFFDFWNFFFLELFFLNFRNFVHFMKFMGIFVDLGLQTLKKSFAFLPFLRHF